MIAVTYVIVSTCVADYSCVEACPVDCISPGPDESGFLAAEQLFINPATCIDCAACVTVCPVDAIHPGDRLPDRWSDFAAVNASWFAGEVRV